MDFFHFWPNNKEERKWIRRDCLALAKSRPTQYDVVSILLGFLLETAYINTQVTLLSIGLFTFASVASHKQE